MLRVTLVQTSLHWENPDDNRSMLTQKLSSLEGKTDLILLPEMFTTGFTMRADVMAETMQGPTISWLTEQASRLNTAIAGSFICSEDNHFYNRFVFVRPDGTLDTYDKKHLFTLAGENEHYVAGRKRVVVEWKGWRICPMICYDLRFPVWSRNMRGTFFSGLNPFYDLLIYVANWPSKRAHHWRSLITARAIENQSFAIGVNIVGMDGKNLEYNGDSMVVDYAGQTIAHLADGTEDLITVQLTKNDLNEYRKQLPFLQDADVFEFKG